MNASRLIVSITIGERRMRSLVLIKITLFSIGAFLTVEARAESPSVTAVLSSSETALGQPVHLQVQVNGVAKVVSPQSIEVNGLDIRYTGESQNFALRNFQTSSSIMLDYTIMPMKAGTFKIPPQSIRAGNTTLRTPELTLHVMDAPNRGIARGNQGATPILLWVRINWRL